MYLLNIRLSVGNNVSVTNEVINRKATEMNPHGKQRINIQDPIIPISSAKSYMSTNMFNLYIEKNNIVRDKHPHRPLIK